MGPHRSYLRHASYNLMSKDPYYEVVEELCLHFSCVIGKPLPTFHPIGISPYVWDAGIIADKGNWQHSSSDITSCYQLNISVQNVINFTLGNIIHARNRCNGTAESHFT